MVTYYNKTDLAKFGKYLLSEQREQSLRQTDIENPKSLPHEERKQNVYNADIANWMNTM